MNTTVTAETRFPEIDVRDPASKALATQEIHDARVPCYDANHLIGDCITSMGRIAPPEAARLREFPPLVRRCVLVSALLDSPVVRDAFGFLDSWIFSRYRICWRAQAPPGDGLLSAEATRLAGEHHVLALGRSLARNGALTKVDCFEFMSPASLAAFVRHIQGDKK